MRLLITFILFNSSIISLAQITIFIHGQKKNNHNIFNHKKKKFLDSHQNEHIGNSNGTGEFSEDIQPYTLNLNISDYDPINDIQISRVYWDVNLKKPSSYWNADKLQFKDGYNRCLYQLTEFKTLGSGTFSEVFLGKRMTDGKKVVLKKLFKGYQRYINREIQILSHLRNNNTHNNNIVQMIDAVRDFENENATLIFEYMEDCEELSDQVYQNKLTMEEIKLYSKQLFEAIEDSHRKGIMHRDIKLENIILSRKEQKVVLIDWGVGDFYFPKKQFRTRAGTRYFRAPETLVHYKYYDYSVDVWSVGCILAEMVFQKHPFFYGRNNDDQLYQVVKVLGSQKLYEFLDNYNVQLEDDLLEELAEQIKKLTSLIISLDEVPLEEFINDENREFISFEVIDLLKKILVYDHRQRISAKEALEHPFFNNLKLERIEW